MDGNSIEDGALRDLRGPIPYGRALEVQEALVVRRRCGEVPDVLWLLEHPPTVTFGTSGGAENLRIAESAITGRGVELFQTRRGGNVTCHEPGQLVGYPIVDWSAERDLHDFLRRLEEALVAALARFGVIGGSIPGRTGVWLRSPRSGGAPQKIAAIGVRAQGWVTSHGFALNLENSLETFGAIVPCGIADAGVTSLRRELGAEATPRWSDVSSVVHSALERALARPLRLVTGEEAVRVALRPRGSTSAG